MNRLITFFSFMNTCILLYWANQDISPHALDLACGPGQQCVYEILKLSLHHYMYNSVIHNYEVEC